MGKHKKKNNNFKQDRPSNQPEEKTKYPILTTKLKRWIAIILLVLLGLVLLLSFFSWAGQGGNLLFISFNFLIGWTVFSLPFILLLGGLMIFKPQKKRVVAPAILSLSLLAVGLSGFFAVAQVDNNHGGLIGRLLGRTILRIFGFWVAVLLFGAVVLIAVLIIWEFLPLRKFFSKKEQAEKSLKGERDMASDKKSPSIPPKFEVKPIDSGRKKDIIGRQESSKNLQPVGDLSRDFGGKYKRPPLDLLDTVEEKPASGDINYSSQVIKKTLQNFGIDVEMGEVNTGPTVTQYTLKPAEGVKLAKITVLNNDLALSLAAHPIRIEAPIPGRSLVGIEVPNKIRVAVKIGNLFSAPEFQKSVLPLCLTLGRDVMGKEIFVDLGSMPHLLVAGATGSGKTICLNSLIVSLIFRNSPKILRFILIDPKRVEFPVYGNLPHLLTPVIFNPSKAVNALNWLVGEMERRFDILKDVGVRDIFSYNKSVKEKSSAKDGGLDVMPYIVLVIDELADLMMSKGREVEASIVRLSQLARAVGIHLIVATQRPSVEVITGLIKANITSRIAFQVASQVDSRTILDTAGAEKLLGKGDMLFLSSEFSRPKRIQGGFISSGEIKKIVSFIERENTFDEKEDVVSAIEEDNLNGGPELEFTDAAGDDALYEEAKKVVIEYKKASASLLQRRLKIGYARAARLLDILEENNVIGPSDGAKPRDIIIGGGTMGPKIEGDGFSDPSDLEFQ